MTDVTKYPKWQLEWAKFTDDSVKRIKEYSDDTHLEREWMCYVYEQDYGIMIAGKAMPHLYRDASGKEQIFRSKERADEYITDHAIVGAVTPVYQIGNVSYGDESRIEVNPESKSTQDNAVRGLQKKNKKWTIHGHPLKDGKIYTGRQYFSSTDILDEFVNTRDNDSPVVQYVVFPHEQIDTNTGRKVLHNRARVLIFPDSATVVAAMKEASPNTDPMAISRENGFNKNQADGSLANEIGADWFKFQEALGKKGYMGIVDIEGKKQNAQGAEGGSTHLDVEQNTGLGKSFGAEGSETVWTNALKLGVLAAVTYIGLYKLLGMLPSESNVVEDMNAEEGPHWWHQ